MILTMSLTKTTSKTTISIRMTTKTTKIQTLMMTKARRGRSATGRPP